MGVSYYLPHRQPVALLGGLVAGLLFGIGMAAYQRHRERRLQQLGVDFTDMRPVQERTFPLSVDANAAMEKAKTALLFVRKIRPQSIEINGSRITASTGITWQSFGETISLDCLPMATGSSVRITSRPKVVTTMFDGGKGRENVELIAKALTQ